MGTKILTCKDLANLLNVSETSARRYIYEMKQHYKPKSNKITERHFNDYFAIPN